ncbi:hypothetical protein [Streptomyces sp. PT12]|uniref:hypothetical protein n=1 Tax=Streptomyces sp. PT12 TaxID=1510197 RepID=UPI00215C573B|nr:hypothetical protein [Streptomyces sp. PT12]
MHEPHDGHDANDPLAPEAPHGEGGAHGEAPRPLGIGTSPTGHPGVDHRLRRLADADQLPVESHPEVYEDVHRGLRETLDALDRPAPGPVPGPANGS